MNWITTQQAANNYATHNYHTPEEIVISKTSFLASAKWQQERYKRFIELVKNGLPVLLCEGFDDLVEQITNELEGIEK